MEGKHFETKQRISVRVITDKILDKDSGERLKITSMFIHEKAKGAKQVCQLSQLAYKKEDEVKIDKVMCDLALDFTNAHVESGRDALKPSKASSEEATCFKCTSAARATRATASPATGA